MPRPRAIRRIRDQPKTRCFRPENDTNETLKTVEISIDEFEAIRLRDYHDIHQKKSAKLMEISQPTFHRILSSARTKIAQALIEGSIINITGDEFMNDKNKYQCKQCSFEWSSPHKKYLECPDCGSEDIILIQEPLKGEQSDLRQRRSFGGTGVGAGPPMVCKCPNCEYESPKTRGVPCRNTKCPECGIPLCGSD